MRQIIINIPTAKWILGLSASLALLLVVGVGLGLVSAQEGGDQIQIYGSGEATAAPWVLYDNLAGGVKIVESDLTPKGGEDTTGNHITFAFNVVKDAEGNVEGKIVWRDTDLNVVVEGEPVSVEPHPDRGAPTGFSGIPYKIVGVTTKEVTIGKTTFPVGSTIRTSCFRRRHRRPFWGHRVFRDIPERDNRGGGERRKGIPVERLRLRRKCGGCKGALRKTKLWAEPHPRKTCHEGVGVTGAAEFRRIISPRSHPAQHYHPRWR